MSENDIEIIEQIMQLKISNYIKENKDMNKRELAKNIEKILDEKDQMYNMDKEQLKEKLIKKIKKGS